MLLFSPIQAQKRANEEFSSQELDSMRSMLDDPDVSPEVKQNFLYALSNAQRLSEEEIAHYARKVGASADDVKYGGRDLDANMENARASLGTAARQRRSADVERRKEGLAAGGFSTSDEIIDSLEVMLELFGNYHPLYQKAREHAQMPDEPPTDPGSLVYDPSAARAEDAPKSYSHTGLDPKSIKAGVDEFRDIDFTAFRADAEMFNTAHSAVSGSSDEIDDVWQSNTADWTGDAKEAAQGVQERLADASSTLSEALNVSSGHLNGVADSVENIVVELTKELLNLYQDGTVAGMTAHEVDAAVHFLEEGYYSALSRVRGSGWLDEYFIGVLNGVAEDFKKSLSGFCSAYQEKAAAWHDLARSFFDAIGQSYGAFLEAMNEELKPDLFGAPDAGGSGTVDVSAAPGGAPDAGGPGGLPGGGVDTAGSSPGGMAPSAAGGVPDVGASGGGMGVPDAEELIPDGATGTNPVTGGELDIDPATGEPYPIDPETGESITEDSGHHEKLTVEQAGQKFTMTEPDEDGVMDIAVEDGAGNLSEFTLDFGEHEPGDENTDPAGDPSDGFGPKGPEGVHRPGPDGKVLIEAGDLTITAEQPDGPDGPTVVTVEGSDGEPVTYTLGNDDDTASQQGVGARSAEASSSGPEPRNSDPSRTDGGVEHGREDFGPDPRSSGETRGTDVPDTPGAAAPTSGLPGAVVDGDLPEQPESDLAANESSTTHPAAVGGGGGSSFGGGSGGGDLPGDDEADSKHKPSSPSGANLGSAPGGETPAPMPQNSGSASAASNGGMGMMGGMGAMGGAGGGQSDDQERTSSAYRVDGDIFELPMEAVRISGSLDNAPDVPVRFSR